MSTFKSKLTLYSMSNIWIEILKKVKRNNNNVIILKTIFWLTLIVFYLKKKEKRRKIPNRKTLSSVYRQTCIKCYWNILNVLFYLLIQCVSTLNKFYRLLCTVYFYTCFKIIIINILIVDSNNESHKKISRLKLNHVIVCT